MGTDRAASTGLLFAILTSIVSGFAIFVNKFAVGQSDATLFTLIKNALVVLALAAVALNVRELSGIFRDRSSAAAALLVSVFGGGVAFILFFRGLAVTSAVSANFIHKSMFVGTLALSAILLREKLSAGRLAISGALLTGNATFLRISGISFNHGDAMILAATAIWAAEAVVASKYLLPRAGAATVALLRLAGGLPVLLGYLLFFQKTSWALSLPALAWAGVGAGLLALYVTLYFSAIKGAGAFNTTAALAVSPVVTLLLVSAQAGRPLTLAQGIGSLVIAVSVSLLFFLEASGTELKLKWPQKAGD